MRAQRRIRVDGFADSEVNLVVAVVQLKTGQVHLKIQGVEPTIQNLVDIRQLLDAVVRRIDGDLPRLVADDVREMVDG